MLMRQWWHRRRLVRSLVVLLAGAGVGAILAFLVHNRGAPAATAWGAVALLPFALAALTGVAKTSTA